MFNGIFLSFINSDDFLMINTVIKSVYAYKTNIKKKLKSNDAKKKKKLTVCSDMIFL